MKRFLLLKHLRRQFLDFSTPIGFVNLLVVVVVNFYNENRNVLAKNKSYCIGNRNMHLSQNTRIHISRHHLQIYIDGSCAVPVSTVV